MLWNLAERYIDSVCIYIKHKVHAEVNSEEVLQQIGITSIGSRVEQVVREVGVEFQGNESWAEIVFERLRNLRQELALLIRSVRNSLINTNLETLADLRTKMSREWGIDAPIFVGITLAVLVPQNSRLSMLIEVCEVELGPVAQIFWNSHFSEPAYEALEEYGV